MSLSNLDIRKINLADIQGLIDNEERENQYIEYKEILPNFKTPAQKLEFLRDISAFANAEGGDIVFGVEEKRDNDNLPTAIPVAMPGLQNINSDAVQRQIEGIVSSGLQPSLRGLQFEWLPKPDGNQILILRTPRSWIRPHAVPMNAGFRVSMRTASGKLSLPFKEIADMIIGSSKMIDRVRKFREERIYFLKHGDLSLKVPPPVVILQMIPAESFERGNRFGAQLLREMSRDNSSLPLGSRGFLKWRYNFDGVLDLDGNDETKLIAYAQYFRNGIIESANNNLFFKRESELFFNSCEIETFIINAFKQYLDLQRNLGIGLPIYLIVSLIHVQGTLITWNTSRHGQNPEPIDREDLILPELIVEDFQVDPATFLRPAFDSIWNAADLPQSLNYDASGNWRGKYYR